VSSSRLIPFEHNDMNDLERLMKIQAEEDKKVHGVFLWEQGFIGVMFSP
jgi:7-keto-8-aminopelargonate synthetase-like enzyme